MNINFKKGIYLLTTLAVLLIQGCGGGGTTSGTDTGGTDTGGTDTGGTDTGGTEGSFKYNKISIAGSSITQGGETLDSGYKVYLGQKSYVGEVIRYFREEVADTIGAYDNITTADEVLDEPMSYGGKLYGYNVGSEITGTLKTSNKIAIAYASNSNTPVIIEMIVDGVSLGQTTLNTNVKPVKHNAGQDNNGESFRENNENAIKEWALSDNKEHTFNLKVIQGNLLLNFITNHMYRFQNAGIGGYSAFSFLDNDGTTTKEIADFSPDLFILESSTNDASTWAREISGGRSTNDWIIESPVTFSLVNDKPKQIQLDQNANVKNGDVVVMGIYDGDINDLAVGIVDQDSNSDIITLKENAPTDENIAKYCKIKNIQDWEDDVKEVVQRVTTNVDHTVDIGIGTSGVPNYWSPTSSNYEAGFARRLMGYREKGKILAASNGWMFYDFFGEVLSVEPGVDTSQKWSKGDNTHPNANGYSILGQAVTKVLKTQ